MCDCKDKNTLADDYNLKRTPHVHADVIKAWADGAAVELWDGGWYELQTQPIWNPDRKYRIKPEPKPLTDLEKYGVEVGDVWRVEGRSQTVHAVQYNRVFAGNHAVTLLGVDAKWGAYNSNFNTLLFRRGVVNKL